MKTLTEWSKEIHSWAIGKGFYQHDSSGNEVHVSGNFASLMMLVLTEVSEMTEALNDEDIYSFREEVADTLIRLLDIYSFTQSTYLLDTLDRPAIIMESWPELVSDILDVVSKSVEYDRKGDSARREIMLIEAIRQVLCIADRFQVDFLKEIEDKMEINRGRPHKHDKRY